jgi:NAD(P)-dependent dehydrogenase (short-subunit alcohol dehydrogenase family)
MYELKGRTALVTGAGPNIGRAIAVTLARAGATVFCNDVDAAAADAAARAASEAGGARAYALAFDVADAEAVEKAIGQAHSRGALIDILVNNAAMTIPKGILDVSLQEWRRVLDINLSGMFYCSRLVAKALVAAKKAGAIVNVASTSGHRGRRNAIAYCSSKGGVLNFTRAMAVDLAPYGIRVNSVSPTKTGRSVGNLEAAGIRTYDEIPLGRLGDPQDQANAVLFLASDHAAFITGADLRVDGGAIATWGSRTIFDQAAKPAA